VAKGALATLLLAPVLAARTPVLAARTPVLAAQEVRLPLERFHELERRARETAPVQEPAAPFVLERAEIAVSVAAERATIDQRLDLVVADDAWHRVALPSPGRWVRVELGALEGRLESDGGALTFRGAGRHVLALSAVAPVERRTRFGRSEWSVSLVAPAAGVVVGSARAELAGPDAGPTTVEIGAGGLALGAPGADGVLQFAARPGQALSIVVRAEGGAITSEMETVVDLDAITLARVRPTRLSLLDRLVLRVVRGELAEAVFDLPDGSTVEQVEGAAVTAWRTEPDGRLRVSLDPAQTGSATLEVMRDQPLVAVPNASGVDPDPPAAEAVRDALVTAATPLLPAARITRSVFAIEAEADGIVTLLDAGSSRGLSSTVAPELRATLPPAAQRTGRLLAAGPTPRWEVAWPDDSQVLAATVDELRADWLWGVSGRAALRLYARTRSSGLEILELELPPSFELTAATLDGRAIEPGRRGDTWAIPLRVDGESQVVALEGTVSAARPRDGEVLELAVPAASAPISRVTVRAVLDGRYAYRLLDAERLETGQDARRSVPGWEWPTPPGHVSVAASWGALSTTPGPLRLEVRDEPEEATWY
jgi:hypothetical protein